MGSQVSMEVRGVHVVIVGGGFGGITAASQLQALNISFTLVDMKDSFHHNVAALRASVESGFARKTFISYSKSFKNSFRQGVVVEIDLKNQTVLLEDGEVSRADSCWWDTWAGLPGRPHGGERPLAPSPAWC